MGYEVRDQQKLRDLEYQNLKSQKTDLEKRLANWVDQATNLHNDSPLQTDKDEILGLRADMIAKMRVTLGV